MKIKYSGLLGDNRLIGAFLLSIAVFAETIALFTQYYLGFQPCSLCVLIRASVALIGMAGIVLMLTKGTKLEKHGAILGITTTIFGTYKTIMFAVEGLKIEMGLMLSQCSDLSPFPSFLPLDTLMPSIFKHVGACGQSPIIAFNFSIMELTVAGFILFGVVHLFLFYWMIIRMWNSSKA